MGGDGVDPFLLAPGHSEAQPAADPGQVVVGDALGIGQRPAGLAQAGLHVGHEAQRAVGFERDQVGVGQPAKLTVERVGIGAGGLKAQLLGIEPTPVPQGEEHQLAADRAGGVYGQPPGPGAVGAGHRAEPQR